MTFLVRRDTCDTAYNICELRNNVSYPTDENQRANEGYPAMSNMIRRHKCKQNSPWHKERLPKYPGQPQINIVHFPRFWAFQLFKKLEIICEDLLLCLEYDEKEEPFNTEKPLKLTSVQLHNVDINKSYQRSPNNPILIKFSYQQ